MAQRLDPDSDIDIGNFFPTPLWENIDDGATPNDNDYISNSDPNPTQFEVGLTNPSSAPGSGDTTVTVRTQCSDIGSGYEFTLDLYEGATLRGTSTQAFDSTTFKNYTLVVASGISNFNNLSVRYSLSVVVDARVDVSWIKVDVPNASGGTAYTMNAESGSYTLTGQAASLLAQRLMKANVGTYMVIGQAAALLAGRKLNASAGSYTQTGAAAKLLAQRLMKATGGAYTQSGAAASLLAQRLMNAEPGVYIIKGKFDPVNVMEFLVKIQKEKKVNIQIKREENATVFIVRELK